MLYSTAVYWLAIENTCRSWANKHLSAIKMSPCYFPREEDACTWQVSQCVVWRSQRTLWGQSRGNCRRVNCSLSYHVSHQFPTCRPNRLLSYSPIKELYPGLEISRSWFSPWLPFDFIWLNKLLFKIKLVPLFNHVCQNTGNSTRWTNVSV